MHEISGESAWTCPNDRQLCLRAKLRSGWSVRSNQISRKDAPNFTDVEIEKIRNVMNKAMMLEEMEQERIGSLVHRLDIMRKNSMGDGKVTCILCAESFGKFMGNTFIVCWDCKRKVCHKCCVDYGTGMRPSNGKQHIQNPTATWLCKICSENRELWKRSGAWFFQSLPTYKLPEPEPSLQRKQQRYAFSSKAADSPILARKDKLALPESPASLRGHNRSLSGSSTGSFQWTKLSKPHYTSSSEPEESSDDDGITLGKTNKATNIQLRSSDALSVTSSTSLASVGERGFANNSPAVSRKSSRRKTFRGKRNPKVAVTDEGDTTSIDSRATERSVEDNKLIMEMSTLHSGSTGNMQTEDAIIPTTDKENRGTLEFSLLYDPLKCRLHVELIRAKNLIAMDTNGFSDPYVKLHLLPGISRATKLRTKTKNKTLNPTFNETLTYWGVLEQELATRKLLLTVLDDDRFGHDFIGEVIIPLKGLAPTEKKVFNLPLQAAYALKENEKLPGDPGRIYMGLRYHTKEHYLSVKIHRCTSLVPRKKDHERSNVNSFVKVSLTFDNNRTITQKTDVKKKTPNPLFDQDLKFKVPAENGQAELARSSLQITVVNKDALAQDVIGSIHFGIDSAGDQIKQWSNCLKHGDQQFDKWHMLSNEAPRKSKAKP